jgi:uncharacterized protein
LEARLTDPAAQRQLVLALQHATASGRNVGEAELVETHISYVLLTGPLAYKIKKAVDFGFLDFTTLAARQFYCAEEVRLNRRLAPDTYMGVARITGDPALPTIDGDGPVLEYAVRMRQFDQEGLLSRVLARGALSAADIDALAAEVASFHGRTSVSTDGRFARAEHILQQALQNFEQILPLVDDPGDRSELDALLDWTRRTHAALEPRFEARRRHGFIRECHGDLHLGNIALIDGRMTLFDCIEFNESMRWTDVMSDVAFLVMDLRDRGRPNLAARFLTAYLDLSGDYDGLAVLRFYFVYRALVRAKVARLRLTQSTAGAERASSLAEYRAYVGLAHREIGRNEASITITHGPSGSGKTTRSQALLEATGAIRVRSDVERKRIFGLNATAHSHSAVGSGLYNAATTTGTYNRLSELARTIAQSGYRAIVDATFLTRTQRDLLRQTASQLGVPFAILDCSAPAAILRERIVVRIQKGGDASEATLDVLERQLATAEPLTVEEQRMTLPATDAIAPQAS